MIHCEGQAIRGRLEDLATTGIGLHVDLELGFARLVGQAVHVDVAFDHGDAWTALPGHVARAEGASSTIAVAFDELPSELEDYIQNQLLAAVEQDQRPHVVLVDLDARHRATFAKAFRFGGCRVVEAWTPEEAIAWIDDSHGEPEVIMLGDSLPETVAEELRDLLYRGPPVRA